MSCFTYSMDDLARELAAFYEEGMGRQYVDILYRDEHFSWRESAACGNGGLPAVYNGQSGDCRFPQPDGSSLHAHWYENGARFHLDRIDPQASPLHAMGHVLMETPALPGGAVTGVLGRLLLGSSPAGWLLFGLGALVAANRPDKPKHVWVVTGKNYYTGRLEMERVAVRQAA